MTVTVTAEHVYKEPVEVVAATHLTKFPNEHDPNILSCSVIERRVQDDGRTYTRRVAAVRNVLPHLLRRVGDADQEPAAGAADGGRGVLVGLEVKKIGCQVPQPVCL